MIAIKRREKTNKQQQTEHRLKLYTKQKQKQKIYYIEDMMDVKQFIILVMMVINIERVVLQRPTLNDNNNPTLFNIGGVLSTSDSEDHFRDTIAVSF